MRERAGLPIAAYLGMLMALGLAAAFIATLAIVIFLPPRPPDVLRADKVAEHFQEGYDHMTALGRAPSGDGVVWEVRNEAPDDGDEAHRLNVTQRRLAHALELDPDQVVATATHIKQDDSIVFRVASVEELARQTHGEIDPREIADEIQRAHDQAAERMERAREAAREAAEAAHEAEEARREAELDRQHARMERHWEAERERLEAMAERQQRAAERQARAAERLAARIQRQVHLSDGEVVVVGEVPDMEFDFDIEIPETPERPAVGAPAPPTPPAPRVQPVPRTQPAIRPGAAREAAQATPGTSAAQRAQTAAVPTPPRPAVAPLPPIYAPAPAGVVLISGFEFGAQLPDGRWLVMRQGRNWAEIGWIARAAAVIGGTLLILTVLSALFARRLTRPIRSFADAVQAVGVNPQSEPVREEGPQELRGAARAVNTMQARLRALIADRTKTLAAVAHDMRTPLMRLRLTAEKATPELRERMAREIAEVEALVASFIAFARDDPAEEARVRLDLSALLQSIADDNSEAGRNVSFEGEEERFVITGQSLGLKRLFTNLVENALKYGASARIKARREEGTIVIDVEDDGPGIPPDQREKVFEPFVRLNEEGTRGAGLGLAAARSIARAHGGDIAILDGEGGALLRVTLPG